MSAETELDIRWPIGLLFTLMGIMVAVYGFVSGARTEYRPLAAAPRIINLNLWWGIVMLVFGLIMIGGALRSDRNIGD